MENLKTNILLTNISTHILGLISLIGLIFFSILTYAGLLHVGWPFLILSVVMGSVIVVLKMKKYYTKFTPGEYHTSENGYNYNHEYPASIMNPGVIDDLNNLIHEQKSALTLVLVLQSICEKKNIQIHKLNEIRIGFDEWRTLVDDHSEEILQYLNGWALDVGEDCILVTERAIIDFQRLCGRIDAVIEFMENPPTKDGFLKQLKRWNFTPGEYLMFMLIFLYGAAEHLPANFFFSGRNVGDFIAREFYGV